MSFARPPSDVDGSDIVGYDRLRGGCRSCRTYLFSMDFLYANTLLQIINEKDHLLEISYSLGRTSIYPQEFMECHHCNTWWSYINLVTFKIHTSLRASLLSPILPDPSCTLTTPRSMPRPLKLKLDPRFKASRDPHRQHNDRVPVIIHTIGHCK